MKEQLECMELCLQMDDEPTETLCVRVKGKTGKGDVLTGVCQRLPDQEEQADEALYR